MVLYNNNKNNKKNLINYNNNNQKNLYMSNYFFLTI